MNATRDKRTTLWGAARRRGTPARLFMIAAMIMALVAPAVASQQTGTSPQELLGQAMHEEIAMGDPTAAIALYERVVAHGSVDLGTRLQAELRLAGLLAKTGDSAAARSLLEGIVDSTATAAGHAEIAASARDALAALGENAGPSQDRVLLSEPAVITALGLGPTYRSPDGRYGAFTDYGAPRQEPIAPGGEVGGGYNVGIVDYETEEITRLTNFATLEEGISDLPLWAPDSRRLAYAARWPDRDHEIRVFTVGGASRTVFRRAASGRGYAALPASWSPDGRALALALANDDGSLTVGILDVASGDLTQLATFPWPRGLSRGPQFSPDGRYLAFVRTVDGNNEIFTLSVDGSRMTRLTDDPGTDGRPLWSRDGNHVLFTSDRLGGNGLWAIALEDGRPTSAPMLLNRSWPGFRGMRWIGDRLAYFERLYPRDVYTLPLDAASGEATGPARKVPYTPAGPQVGIAWSRDGALTFLSWTNPDKVVVLYPDGTTDDFRLPAELEGQGELVALQFDTTGKVVSFAVPRVNRMASVDIESGEWSVLRLPEDIRGYPAKGPEPDTLYYLADGVTSPTVIRRLDLISGETTKVFEFDQEALLHRMWLSPDGSRLRIANGRTFSELDLTSGDVEDLFTVDRSLPAGSCTGEWGDVSPDGGKMAIAGVDELFVLDLESGESHGLGVRLDQLFAGLPTDGGIACFRHVRWSPTGDRLAFMIQFPTMQHWTIEDPLAKVLSDDRSR